MKILIPTDFSELSKIAVQYVIGLSKDFKIDIVLLHVANNSTPNMTRLGSKKLIEAIKSSSEQEMNELLHAINKANSHDLNISTKIIYGGSITEKVEAFALNNQVDMICIGTKGATGLKKIVFGSNAAGIITNSSIPVLTIPEFASYNGINNIVYSSDLENLDNELKSLLPFAKLLHAWINVIHINKEHLDPNVDADFKAKEERLKTLLSYDKLKTKALENESVINGINQHVEAINAEMIAMFTHSTSTSLFEKLFNTHKSVTREAAFQTKIPLLTFKKE